MISLKVELVKITAPEQSDEEHHKLVENAEACLQARYSRDSRDSRYSTTPPLFSNRYCHAARTRHAHTSRARLVAR